MHHAEYAAHVARGESPFAGARIDPVVGERRRHYRQIARIDQDRALPKVKIEVPVRRLLDHAGIQLKIGDGSVAVARFLFRSVDRFVDGELPAGKALKQGDDPRPAVFERRAADHRRRRDRTGVDHRVERPLAAFVEDDGIEGIAARLDTNPAQHLVGAVVG